jgi:hypothetical protein
MQTPAIACRGVCMYILNTHLKTLWKLDYQCVLGLQRHNINLSSEEYIVSRRSCYIISQLRTDPTVVHDI